MLLVDFNVLFIVLIVNVDPVDADDVVVDVVAYVVVHVGLLVPQKRQIFCRRFLATRRYDERYRRLVTFGAC